MEDVPLPSSTQTTDQIIVFPDIEGKEGGGSEESAIETVNCASNKKEGETKEASASQICC